MFILVLLTLFAIGTFGIVHADGNSGSSNSGSGSDDSCTVDSDCDSDELCISGECEDSFDDDRTMIVPNGCSKAVISLESQKECESIGRVAVAKYKTDCSYEIECEDAPSVDPTSLASNTNAGAIPNSGAVPNYNAPARPIASSAGYAVSTCVTPELQKEFNELMMRLREKMSKNEDEDVTELKQKIERLSAKIRQANAECNRARTSDDSSSATATGIKCQVPLELRTELEKAWADYKIMLESPEDEDMTAIRSRISQITEKIESYRANCKERTEDIDSERCNIPKDYLSELEKLYKEYYGGSRSGQNDDSAQKETIKTMIEDYEEKIKHIREGCKRFLVNDDINTEDIAKYYTDKFSEVSDIEDSQAQIEKLKDLRKEIDQTIRELIQQRKKLNFNNDLSGMVDEVTFTSEGVQVGDESTGSSEIEIETEVEGSTVSISTENDSVIIEQEGLRVDTKSVAITKNGVAIDGTNLKIPPSKLLEVKSLEQNRERIQNLKLEKKDDKIFYRAEFEAKKRFLGIFPATADQSVEVDAETGIVTEDKPWWTSISTDAK
ncbi:MAG: hypothetical protein ACP5NV_03990 [Candidatus Woesearchaeota archaeon]